MILFITAAQAFLPVLLFQVVQNIPLYTGAVHCFINVVLIYFIGFWEIHVLSNMVHLLNVVDFICILIE